MLEEFQGDSWGSIPPLRMSSLLPHDLCHGRSTSLWPPTSPPSMGFSIGVLKTGFGISSSLSSLSSYYKLYTSLLLLFSQQVMFDSLRLPWTSDSPILYYLLEFSQIHEIAFLLARHFLTISSLKAGPYLFCLVYPGIYSTFSKCTNSIKRWMMF